MGIRVYRNLETYKCYTFLEMGNDEGYDYKVNLRISFTLTFTLLLLAAYSKHGLYHQTVSSRYPEVPT